MKQYSEEVALTIQEFIKNEEWHYFFDDDEGMFRFWLAAKGKLKNLSYLVIIHDDAYTVYAISPIGADQDDEEMMQNLTEFVGRANIGLRNGNFEFDFHDGEIRYKTYVNCAGGSMPITEIIAESIYVPMIMFRQYESCILDIVYQNVPAKQAMAKRESEKDDAFWDWAEEFEPVDDDVLMEICERLEEKNGAEASREGEGTEES